MERLDIPATTNSPRILFDPNHLIFLIEGESRPENVETFYTPVLNWMTEYMSSLESSGKSVEATFKMNLEFANSSSIKMMLTLLNTIGGLTQKTDSVFFDYHWYHDQDDDDGVTIGEELEELSELQFSYFAN